MDYYTILKVNSDATIEELKNAYLNNKNKRAKYDLKLLKYYRELFNKKENLINEPLMNFNSIFQNMLNSPNELNNKFMKNILNDKNTKKKSYAMISSTTGKNGEYVTKQSTRVFDGKNTKQENKTIKIDKDGNKIIQSNGDNLFKTKIKISNLLNN